MEPLGGVSVGKALLDASIPWLGLPVRELLPLPAEGQVLVPGDLAQLHPQLAVPPEAVNGGKRPEKDLLGHLLRRRLILTEGQGVFVNVREILPVDRFKSGHSLTTFQT